MWLPDAVEADNYYAYIGAIGGVLVLDLTTYAAAYVPFPGSPYNSFGIPGITEGVPNATEYSVSLTGTNSWEYWQAKGLYTVYVAEYSASGATSSFDIVQSLQNPNVYIAQEGGSPDLFGLITYQDTASWDAATFNISDFPTAYPGFIPFCCCTAQGAVPTPPYVADILYCAVYSPPLFATDYAGIWQFDNPTINANNSTVQPDVKAPLAGQYGVTNSQMLLVPSALEPDWLFQSSGTGASVTVTTLPLTSTSTSLSFSSGSEYGSGRMAVNSLGTVYWLAGDVGEIQVLAFIDDVWTITSLTTIPSAAGLWWITLTPDDHRLIITDPLAECVYVVQASDGTLLATVTHP
jgi:hypothetical protein